MRPCARRLTATNASPSAYVRAMKHSLIASLFIATTASASTFHVSPTGNDSAAGTDTAPFLTIQRAADRVQPGDTVDRSRRHVHGLHDRRSRHAGRPDPVHRATARSTSMAPRPPTATRSTSKAPRTSRSRASRSPARARAGSARSTCDHITIRNNVADQNAKWGIFSAFCDYLTVEDNQASRSGEQHGIYASNSADHPVIRGNTIWGNAMCGIHMNGDISQGGDGVISRRARREQLHPRQRHRAAARRSTATACPTR